MTSGGSGSTLDCQNHTINGSGTGYGVYLNSAGSSTIRNCTIEHFDKGIYLSNAKNNTIQDSNLIVNNYGAYLVASSNGNRITSCVMNANTYKGLFVQTSSTNNVTASQTCFNGDSMYDLYCSTAQSGNGGNICTTSRVSCGGVTCSRSCIPA